MEVLGRFTVKTLRPPENREIFTVKMEGSYQKYGFSAISIKKEVAARFREFSRDVSRSHTETLEAMLNFFQWNQLSPNDNLGTREDGVKKRINALIAIVKNLERDGVLPTKAMIELLFEGGPQQKKDEEDDLIFSEIESTDLDAAMELLDEKEQRKILQQELATTKAQFHTMFLDRVKPVWSPLGPCRLQLEMTFFEFETLKQLFKSKESCI